MVAPIEMGHGRGGRKGVDDGDDVGIKRVFVGERCWFVGRGRGGRWSGRGTGRVLVREPG